MNKKAMGFGVVIVWAIVLIGMFVNTLLYIGLTEAVDMIDESLGADLNGSHEEAYNNVKDDWDEYPIWVNVTLIIFGVVGTMIQSRDQTYG
jgi:hypothetical protein